MNYFLIYLIIFQVNIEWVRKDSIFFSISGSEGVKGIYKHGYVYGGGNAPQYHSASLLMIFKYDTLGNFVNYYSYSDANYRKFLLEDFAVDDSQNIYVCFAAHSDITKYDYGVLKFKKDSTFPVWVYIYNNSLENGDDFPVSLEIGKDKKIYVTGWSYGCCGENYQVYTIKFLPDGTREWWIFYGYSFDSPEFARGMVVDKDGNIWICGETYDTAGISHLLLLKYDTLGNLLFSDVCSLPNSSFYPKKIIFDGFENIYITGNISINGNSDYLIAKYKINGQRDWVINYGGIPDLPEIGYSCGIDTLGYLYVTGKSGEDIMTLKISFDSNILWSRRYDYNYGEEIGYDIAVDKSGNAYITGSCGFEPSLSDFITLKYTPSGTKLWDIKLGNVLTKDSSYSIFLDENNKIYVVGTTDTIIEDTVVILLVPRLTIVKYSEEPKIGESKIKNILSDKEFLKFSSSSIYDISGRKINIKNLTLHPGIYYIKKKRIIFLK